MHSTATTAARHSPSHAHQKPVQTLEIGPALTDFEGLPAGASYKGAIPLLGDGPSAGQA